jgi:hypothetical protein
VASGIRLGVRAHPAARSLRLAAGCARIPHLSILPLFARTATLPSHDHTLAVSPTGVEPPQIHM